ncbi:MAG TPA: hypothetical protein VEA99_04380 [Gemmatimonadaceae bacterium]|nr:hypothetical protein [Gemmatimonadaceae bacterium]
MAQPIDQFRRASRIAFAALALSTAVACMDSTDPVDGDDDDDEPDVAAIVVSAGGTSATVPNANATPQTGTVTLVRNQANQVSFRFVTANGQDDPVIVAQRSEFRLQASSLLPTSLTFTGAGGTGATFTATIIPTVAGQVTIPFELFNIAHNHAELARSVTVTVQ